MAAFPPPTMMVKAQQTVTLYVYLCIAIVQAKKRKIKPEKTRGIQIHLRIYVLDIKKNYVM